jgi:sulfatase modifying factor 1
MKESFRPMGHATIKRTGIAGGLGIVAAVLALGGLAGIDCSNTSSPSPSPGAAGEDSGADAPVTTDAGADATSAVDAGPPVDGGAVDVAVPVDAADATDSGRGLDAGPDARADGGVVGPASCAPGGAGMTSCGADAGESCCASLAVEGGTFNRTYAFDDAGAVTGEADPATVSSFRLDKYLVTVGRFRQFVNAVDPDGGAPAADAGPAWAPAPGSGKHAHLNGGLGLKGVGDDGGAAYEPGWVADDDALILPDGANTDLVVFGGAYSTWTPAAGTQENLPISGVTWAEAYAFCIWDGGFLPSEAEAEYAAAAGSQQRRYPWGATDPGTGNQYAIYGCNYGFPTAACNDVRNFAPVGSAPLGAAAWGQLDLAGDVPEWNLDWHVQPYVTPCVDCTNLTVELYRATRAGDALSSELLLESWLRGTSPPTDRGDEGIRCARTP